MILGSSGENIYPEEIEQVINGIDDVDESIIVPRDGKLVALVTFNEMSSTGIRRVKTSSSAR